MIWTSVSLMTVIDMLILGIVGYAAAGFLRGRGRRPAHSSEIGSFAILGGLLLVALFYLGDLFIMHAVPSFIPRAEAMNIMRELHLNGSWLVVLLGIGTICLGFTSVNRATAALVGELEARERDLGAELVERKRIEQSLRESRDQMRLITDNLPFAISYLDNERRYRFVNRTVETWFGRPAAEILGHTIGDVLGQEADNAVTQQVAAALKGEEQHDERVIGYPDGKTRTVELTYVPDIDESETVRGCFAFGQDITERKRAEAALRESEALFRVFVDNIPVEIVIRDTEGHFLFVNSEWENAEGPTNEQIIGKTLHEVYSKEGADLYQTQDRTVLETGQVLDQEVEVPAMPGRKAIPAPIAMHTIKFPIRDVHGDITKIGAIGINITERKRTEESSRQLIAAINAMNESVTFYDADDKLVFSNERHRVLNSAAPETLIPGTAFEDQMKVILARGLVPEAQGREDEWLRERLDRHRRPKGPFELLRQDGIWLLIHEQRLPEGGLISLATDITERKQIEQALRESRDQMRLITDHLPAVICYLDSEQRYRFVNRVLEEWYDRPAEEILGRTVSEITGPEVYDQIKSHLEAAISGKEQRFELNRTFPNGITRVLANAYVPHLNERREVQGFFALVHDITEHKQAEEQLRQAQKMEAVGQLTAGVAHDFNNMLAVIWGNAELLEDELGEDNPKLAAVFRATQRGADLTQRLLAFSRKQVLNPEIINANSLIAGITGLLRRTLEEHIDIEAVTGAGLWNCEVDPAQLENALVNLAINARDAMPDGGKLTIETANARLDDDYAAAQAEVTPGQYVMLAVTDTGTGIPPEVRDHVFEPFFTTKAVGAGSGLGLSMIYGFVKQSGGHVTIYSEEGEGTTIKLYLPRSTEAEAVEREPTTDEVPVARGETVLVVEDDPDVRTLAVALLSSLGYQILEAATGAAALEQLGSTTRVNLLLTDVVLAGGMNGRELAAEVERRVPGINVLYMSGYTEDAIVHHGRLDTDAELLQKPFRRADLARAVRRVLDGPSA